jgi:hypothetical protein
VGLFLPMSLKVWVNVVRVNQNKCRKLPSPSVHACASPALTLMLRLARHHRNQAEQSVHFQGTRSASSLATCCVPLYQWSESPRCSWQSEGCYVLNVPLFCPLALAPKHGAVLSLAPCLATASPSSTLPLLFVTPHLPAS